MFKYPVQHTTHLTQPELQQLQGVAYAHGWKREEPRKRWTLKESKEAARFAIEALIRKELDGRVDA